VKTHILALLATGLTVATHAQTAAAPQKVGVIQIQSAIVSTKDGQKAVAELDSKLAPKKKDLDKKAADIRDLQDKLAKGGNAMSQSAKDDLNRNIQQKTTSYNRDMEDAQAEADQEQRKLIDELGQKMMQVIDKYAQTNGYSVILDVSNPNTPVLYASNTVDITKDIIDLYDKSAPTAPASKPGGATSPAATKPAPQITTPKPTAPPPTAPVKKQP
jgi:outer membrane protein